MSAATRLSTVPQRPLVLGRLEWILFAAMAAILVLQLLVPPIVGLADNGDYDRVLQPLGLRPVPEEWSERYFLYVNRDYTAAPSEPALLLSSEHLLAGIARTVDSLLTRDSHTDLLFLGGLQLALYLCGLMLLLSAFPTVSRPARVVLGIGMLVMATDVAYVATFNSFYTESASLIFLAAVIGLVLRQVRGSGAGRLAARTRARARWLPPYFAAAILFVAAKPQNYPLAPLLALPPLVLEWRERRRRWMAAACAVALLAGTGLLIHRVDRAFRSPVLWDTVFYTILPLSPSPEQDLRELGLEPDLARYSGTTSWDAGAPLFETTARYGYDDLALFYLRHPDRLFGICAVCARQAFEWREPLLGNYTLDSGRPPRTLSRRFSIWSDFESQLFPKSIWFLGGVLLLVAAFATRELRLHGPRHRRGGTALLVLLLASMAVVEFLISVAAEGLKDLVKHLYLFQVLFDACLLAAAAYGAERMGRRLPWGFRRSAAVTDPARRGATPPGRPTTPGTGSG